MMLRVGRSASKAAQIAAALFIFVLCGAAVRAEDSAAPAEQTPGSQTPEDSFLRIAPLPAGIENVTPIPGAVNIPFANCAANWPEGYKVFRDEDFAVEGHARRRDIYAWLRAKQAFETRDCSCSGKVAPWEPVEAIYAQLVKTFGEVQIKHTAAYDAEANVLTATVERMCGGRF